jgi:hypothetical protein
MSYAHGTRRMRPTIALDLGADSGPMVKRGTKSRSPARIRWARVVGLVTILAVWCAILVVAAQFL